MARILILGAGAMGSAFCFPLADSGHDVRLVGTHLDQDLIKHLRKTNIHPRLDMHMPNEVDYFSVDEFHNAFHGGIDLIVIGVSSAGIDWAIEYLKPFIVDQTPTLLLTKGLEVDQERLVILPDYIAKKCGGQDAFDFALGAVGGPCIAAELAARRDTRVSIGYTDPDKFEFIKKLFQTSYYHVHFTKDLTGLEICAALKNFYSLAVGYPAGCLQNEVPVRNLSKMNNLSAGIFAQALFEMGNLVEWLKGERRTVQGLAGAGDFYVTCQAGRNSRMATYLGLGMTYKQAKKEKMPYDTVEGAELAIKIGSLMEKLFSTAVLDAARYPLMLAILNAVSHNSPMEIPWSFFED